MSWDVIIINSKYIQPIDQIWDENIVPSFGQRIEIQRKISLLYPDTDWTDPSYGHLDNGIYVGHIMLGNNETLKGNFHLNVYGGTGPLNLISTICNKYNWTAYDTTTSEYIDLNNPEEKGWQQFQDFKQTIVKQHIENMTRKRWWQFWKK